MKQIGYKDIADEADPGHDDDFVAVTGRLALDSDFDGLLVESMLVTHDN